MNNYFKKLALVFVYMLTASVAFAENKVFIQDVTIGANEEQTLSVEINNDVTISSANFDVVLPANLTFVEGSQEKADRLAKKHNLSVVKQDDGSYRFLIIAGSIIDFEGNSGAVVTFKVKSTPSASGTEVIKIKNAELSDMESNGIYPSDSEAKVNYVVRLKGDVSLSAEPVSVRPGETATVSVALSNELDPLSGVQGKIVLPEGLTIEGSSRDGYVFASDRVATPTEEYNPNTGIFIIQNMGAGSFTGTSGVLFTFVVKADENLPQESVITFSGLKVTNTYAQTFEISDATVAVTNPKIAEDEAAAAAAEQAAKEEAEAKAAAEKSIADLEASAAAEIPEEVANNEEIAAAKAAADEAVAAAKKAVEEAEAVKDNEAVAAAVKAAEEAVKKLEDTVAAAVEAYEAEKAAEEALNAAVDKKVAEVEDYARAQKNQMTTNATDVAATFQAKVDEVVAKVKEQVAAAKEAGNLTEDVVDVTAAKNQIDAIYAEAVKAQKSYDKLSEQLDELAEAMEELDDIDFDEMSANNAADIKNQIAELEDALAAAREALNEDQENLAGKSLKDVLGMTATAFNKAINDVKNAVNVATGIKMATVINGAVEVYNVKGVRVDAPVKGLNIVKMADGTIKKLYVR